MSYIWMFFEEMDHERKACKKEYYEIHIDKDKNRIYTTMRGYWENLDVAPNLERDFVTAPQKLQPEYTSLIDVREFKVPGPDVMNMFITSSRTRFQKTM